MRRAPRRVLVPVVVVLLLPAVLFACSWIAPVHLEVGNRSFFAGPLYNFRAPWWGSKHVPDGWQFTVNLPTRDGLYMIQFRER